MAQLAAAADVLNVEYATALELVGSGEVITTE